MRLALFLAASFLGAIIALLGDEPFWLAAVLAVIVFPVAAALADRGRSGPEERPARGPGNRGARPRGAPPLVATLLTALAGGLLIVLLLRLAVAAPDWLSKAAVDCGGPSEGFQRLVLFGAAAVFVASTAPVLVTLTRLGARFLEGPREADGVGPGDRPLPLGFYPLAVAASGLALIASSFVTNC